MRQQTAAEYETETACIHGDGRQEHPFGAVSTPIYQTATFAHPGIGVSSGYDYSRESNPTRTELEQTVNALEKAEDTLACATGMAAISLVMGLFGRGDHLICTEDLYGGSVRLFDQVKTPEGVSFSYVDTSDLAAVEAAIRPETKALYIETPSNPTMKITDLEAVAALAKAHGLLLIVDNTFLTPYLQKPLTLGADLVVHSGTKFLGGHNDTLAGFVCTGSKELSVRLRALYKTTGSCLSPFDSFLVLRGIKTLAVRVERQQSNAGAIVRWLCGHPKIRDVYYPGLPSHPGYESNRKQAAGAGSMISFHTDCAATARRILEKVQVIAYAESLGGVESLITYPMLQTHGDVPVEIRERLGITDSFLRLSVGIEHVDDLIRDLENALKEEA